MNIIYTRGYPRFTPAARHHLTRMHQQSDNDIYRNRARLMRDWLAGIDADLEPAIIQQQYFTLMCLSARVIIARYGRVTGHLVLATKNRQVRDTMCCTICHQTEYLCECD